MKNKTVIITGASSGIGLACAKAFAAQGCNVVMAARSIEKLHATEAELTAIGAEVLSVQTDVTREADCRQLIEKTIARFGRIDILLNNAGISMRAAFADLDLNVLKRLMDVNFWGMVYCTKYAYPYLLESKGSLVGITSVAAVHGMPCRTGYSSSKYAMAGFLDALRVEALRLGLHVMEVIPGFIATNIREAALVADGSPQGVSPREEEKMMTPEELARRIIRGIKKRKRRLATSYEGRFTPIIKLLYPSLVDKLYYKHMKREPGAPLV